MKIKKILTAALSAALVGSVCFGLAGCGGELAAPENFEFTLSTRAYSFDAVSGADSYQIFIEKILNDATGKSLVEGATIQREEKGQMITQPADSAASLVTMPGSEESRYVWSSTTNNTMNIADTDGDGKVSGNLMIYEFKSKADAADVLLNPNDPSNPDEIPLGHYYVSCYSVDKEGNRSEPSWQEIVVGGKLASPKFSYSVENGKMTITVTSSYINDALRTEGLPYSVDFEIDDGSGTKKTVTFDDWAYYTTVIGPETSFNFMFLEKEIDVASADTYTVSAVAKGDGGQILDSDKVTFNEEYSSTSYIPADWFGAGAETISLTGSTYDGMSVSFKLDEASGKYAIEGNLGNKYYGGTYGTFTVDGDEYTFTPDAASGSFGKVNSFAVNEKKEDGTIKKATANITVSATSYVGVSGTLDISYEERGGWWPGGGPGGGPGGPGPR